MKFKFIKEHVVPAVIAFLVAIICFYPNHVRGSVYSCDEVIELDDSQLAMVFKSYQLGYEDDLGYTLAAISWQESSLGKYRVNPLSNDYGAYGINYLTIQRIDKINYYKTIKVLEKVIFNDELGSKYALETLRWNLRHFKGDWRKSIAMYNAGFQWRSQEAREYVVEIVNKVNTLKTCLPM